ncbi:hypothetical protein GCM10009612_18000 [Streptomyces beijiangensis]
MSWGTFQASVGRGTPGGELERPSRLVRTPADRTQMPLCGHQTPGPDPVGGIRPGKWEAPRIVDPWGDRRRGAFRFFRYSGSSLMGRCPGGAPRTPGLRNDRASITALPCGTKAQRPSTGMKSRRTSPVLC